MRFRLSKAIFRRGKTLLKNSKFSNFKIFVSEIDVYHPVTSKHSPGPTVQILWTWNEY